MLVCVTDGDVVPVVDTDDVAELEALLDADVVTVVVCVVNAQSEKAPLAAMSAT